MKQTFEAIGSAIGILVLVFALLAFVGFMIFMFTYSENGSGSGLLFDIVMTAALILPIWAAVASYRKVKHGGPKDDRPAP